MLVVYLWRFNMGIFNSFEELKQKRKEYVSISKDNGLYEGIKDLLTDLYPDEAHFIFELLQNAEDKAASDVWFNLYNDRLVFEHNGKKRDFTLEDIEAITGIGNSPKKDDNTAIGKFGVGFKAVYAYTNTPEIHSGEYNFRIYHMLIPDDSGVAKTSRKGFTSFVFPFDSENRTPKQAVNEIAKGLIELDAGSILFLKNIKHIHISLPNNKCGSIDMFDIDDVKRTIKKKNPNTGKESVSYWYKFTRSCDVFSEDKLKNCDVNIAFRAKEVDNDFGGVDLYVDSTLDGDVCIFFPAVKENSKLHFSINAPFASTVARDSVRSCPENKKLIDEIAKLSVDALKYFKKEDLLNLDFYESLPVNRDFNPYYSSLRSTSIYYPIYMAIHEELRNGYYIMDDLHEANRPDEVQRTNRDIVQLFDSKDALLLFGKSWLPAIIPQSRAHYFFDDLGVKEFKRTDLINSLFENPDLFENIFKSKNDEWFELWFNYLDESIYYMTENDLGFYKDLKMIKCSDGNLYCSNDVVYIDAGDYKPINIVNPIFVVLKKSSRQSYYHAVSFLEKLGIRKMDEAADIDNGNGVDTFYACNTIMEIIDKMHSGKDIGDYSDKRIVLAYDIIDNSLHSVLANECCISKEIAFFYSEDKYFNDVHYVIALDIYKREFNNDQKYMQDILKVFIKFGLHNSPLIYPNVYPRRNPQYNKLDTRRENINREFHDYNLTGCEYLDKIGENRLFDESRLLWDYLVNYKSAHHEAIYAANSRAPYQHIESIAAYYLKRAKWIPNKEGVFCRPCDITEDDLYEGYDFKKDAQFLINIGFGDKSKAPKDLIEALKGSGIDIANEDLAILDMLANSSPEEKEEFVKFLAKQQKEKKKLTLSQAINESTKVGFVSDVDDDYLEQDDVPNPDKRMAKVKDKLVEGLDEKSKANKRISYIYRRSSKEEKTFLYEQYKGYCQICHRPPIVSANGKHYFEAINIVSTAKLDPKYLNNLDVGWNSLSLCPNCAAEYKNCAKDLSNLENQVVDADIQSGGMKDINISLKNEETKISFTQRHLIALKAALQSFTDDEE